MIRKEWAPLSQIGIVLYQEIDFFRESRMRVVSIDPNIVSHLLKVINPPGNLIKNFVRSIFNNVSGERSSYR